METKTTVITQKRATKQLYVSEDVHYQIRLMALTQKTSVNCIIEELLRKNNDQES